MAVVNRSVYQLFILAFSILIFSSCSEVEEEVYKTIELETGWTIQASVKVNKSGEILSEQGVNTDAWHEAIVPGTVMANLVNNGVYKDIYKDKNLDKVDTSQFKKSWWYRTEFKLDKDDAKNYNLVFEGINYRANIWVNGKKIADSDFVETAFRMFTFNVSDIVSENNVLAVEILPPGKTDLSIGFVDWNPESPDRNMGIWRGVKIVETGKVALVDPVITSDVDVKSLKSADLKIETEVVNYSDKKTSSVISGTIGDITFSKEIEVEANSTINVEFTAKDYPQLTINNPKLWWPNGLGEPNMYDLNLKVISNNTVSDARDIRFGIRDIEQFITPDGNKGWKVNGKRVLIKGAGWVDDLFLNDADQKVIDQLKYVKHMNLNTVRLEGFWGKNKTLFNTCDELGLMLMIGWSCQWEWEHLNGRPTPEKYMSITSAHDIKVHTQGFADHVTWLRNHPSVFLWVFGSDKLPIPELEEKLNTTINALDGKRPILSTCKTWDSDISGPSGVKMFGPYGYTGPNYWSVDTLYGGAYGFNTETGPGPQIPPMQSLKKMISEDKLWPMGEEWKYHLGRNRFHKLDRFTVAMDARYGKPENLEEFIKYSEISSYESMRPMFEAFAVNKKEGTGVVQWMLNSAWPEMFWQLYDYYLMPNSSFYATKKGALPVNAIYQYVDNSIYLTNETFENLEGLVTEVKMFDINSKELFSKVITHDIGENASDKIFVLPAVEGITTSYFVHVNLKDSNGVEIVNKLYWLSTKEDTYDWDKTYYVYTPPIEFADFTGIKKMPKVEVVNNISFVDEGSNTIATVELKNPSDKIAFFIEMQVIDKNTQESVLPVFWSDNYISLLPGETRSYTAKFAKTNHADLELVLN